MRYMTASLREVSAAEVHRAMQDAFRGKNTLRERTALAGTEAFHEHMDFRHGDGLANPSTKKCAYYFGDGRQHPVLGPTLRALPHDVLFYCYYVGYHQQSDVAGAFVFPGATLMAREERSVFLCSFAFASDKPRILSLMLRWIPPRRPAEQHTFEVAIHADLCAFRRGHEVAQHVPDETALTSIVHAVATGIKAAVLGRRPAATIVHVDERVAASTILSCMFPLQSLQRLMLGPYSLRSANLNT
jgi:hypothetical protein